MFVGDHVSAIRKVLEAGRPGEVYNVGGDAERENIHVVKTICALLDERRPLANGAKREALITFVADRPGHDRRYAIDAGKIKRELNWTQRETFESGITKTVDWYLANAKWCERVLDGTYRGERLGVA
jgi:dTDP-glucose 4,6-dehydratase